MGYDQPNYSTTTTTVPPHNIHDQDFSAGPTSLCPVGQIATDLFLCTISTYNCTRSDKKSQNKHNSVRCHQRCHESLKEIHKITCNNQPQLGTIDAGVSTSSKEGECAIIYYFMDSTMPPVYSTPANNDSIDTASSFDSDHDGIYPYYDPFLLKENQVQSFQDLTAFFSPPEAKKVAKAKPVKKKAKK